MSFPAERFLCFLTVLKLPVGFDGANINIIFYPPQKISKSVQNTTYFNTFRASKGKML